MHKQSQLRVINHSHIFWRLMETPMPVPTQEHIAYTNGRYINKPRDAQLCRQTRSGRKYVIVFL